MINALDSIARNLGCNKALLNCDPKKEGFYERCGYARSGLEMQHNFKKEE